MEQRTFESCKPFYIATPKSQDRISCCCRIHVETKMVFQSCMEFRRKLDQLPDEYIAYEHLSDLVNQTLCPKQDGKDYHESNCLLRKCDKCRIKMRFFTESRIVRSKPIRSHGLKHAFTRWRRASFEESF